MTNQQAYCFDSLSQSAQLRMLLEGLQALEATISQNVPPWDENVFTYYSGTNNIASIVYKKDSVTVATRTFTYTVQPPIADNALIAGQTITIA